MKEHLRVDHNVQLEISSLQFRSYDEFTKWRLNTQLESITQFIIRYNQKYSTFSTKLFVCHRSGMRLLKENSTKFPRRNGFKKLNTYCPAEIMVRISHVDGKCAATFVKTHMGHNVGDEKELRFIYLDKTERLELAANLKSDILQRKREQLQRLTNELKVKST